MQPPAPISHLAFDRVDGDKTPDSVLPRSADLKDAPLRSTGPGLCGSAATTRSCILACRSSAAPTRSRSRCACSPTEQQDRAVVLHQSRAWTDAGSRGFELTLDRGRPVFALVHFWPGNAVAVRAATAAAARRLVAARHHLRRLQPRRRHPSVSERRTAGDRGDPRSLVQGHHLRSGGGRQRRRAAASDHRRAVQGQRLQERPDRRPADLLDGADRRGSRRDGRPASIVRRGLRTLPRPGAIGRERPPPASSRECARRRMRCSPPCPEIMVMEEMRTPRPAHRLDRGSYDAPREIVARDTPGEPAAVSQRTAAQPARARAMADEPRQSARRAGRRESHLAHALRPRHRWHPGGLRQPGTTADSSRAARLPRRTIRAERLGRQGAAPVDRRRLRRFSSPRTCRPSRGPRSRQSTARPRPEAPPGRRVDPRQRAGRERPAQPHDRRAAA